MVAPSSDHNFPPRKTKAFNIPVIDFSLDKSLVFKLLDKACEKYGFFKLVNHGTPDHIISNIEKECSDFFSKSVSQKQVVGPPSPFGYGCKSIGSHGDMGELEYLLLDANPLSVSQTSKTIFTQPHNFSCAVNSYVRTMEDLTFEILDLVAHGLRLTGKSVFSSLVKDNDNDSCFRVNHYLASADTATNTTTSTEDRPLVGFGEHSDPQILTILRSNDVGCLQILSPDDHWIPVPPNPSEFCVFVGEALQVLTNKRLVSVRHRVLTNSKKKPRMSMMYFGAPSLKASLSLLPELVTSLRPRFYRPFTWGEYKIAAYSGRLETRALIISGIRNDRMP